MFKFSIRDLLWLTVVVALAVALIYVKRPIATGRYQMISGAEGQNYILDTTTGKIWAQSGYQPWDDAKWNDYKSPGYGAPRQ
ncbi:MAG TPA: hypothetical protein VMP01_12740 [Pirellulaceae bacterium]|nr:hypothetical protein [Pirellulaceae bacterium]